LHRTPILSDIGWLNWIVVAFENGLRPALMFVSFERRCRCCLQVQAPTSEGWKNERIQLAFISEPMRPVSVVTDRPAVRR
jgi:hypothetical protein